MTSAHIDCPLCHCWRHIGAVVTAAMGAVLSPPLLPSPLPLPLSRLPLSPLPATFWLIFVCPCAASASATIACPRACRCWLPTPLPLLSRPLTAAPCSFSCNRVMFKILHLKYYFEHICCHFLVDCCLPSRCLCFRHCCLPRRCVFVSLLIVVAMCYVSTASCLSSTMTGWSRLMFKILLSTLIF